MSTEDKSLVVAVVEPPQQQQQPPEPGAPPPAAAAAATDKRPRGRPRKDGASPFQRARKKNPLGEKWAQKWKGDSKKK
ncbi:histone-lysine N-methyltransferase 2C-like [Empidonax traillii]|uniref:histone-lysine N-methyltransferase 2C-like n=1 Tax=Empidonax traillii TaxID=164674 RepID=UPI000FFD2109|nr:histone-lysine N-methyltransferase 2C-like [Empidonax traillii]